MIDFLSDCAVVFDAVGTVMYPQPSVADVYRKAILDHCDRDLPAEIVGQKLHEALSSRSASRQLQTSETAEREFWADIVRELCPQDSGFDDCFEALFQHFALPASWRCFSDVDPCFRLLSKQARIAIASNFDSRLNQVCDGLPDLASVSTRIISSLVGYRKPSKQFYHAVATTLKLPASQILMVGDDFENDVRGARQAGLHAAWLCRVAPEPEQVDLAKSIGAIVVTSLSEVAELLPEEHRA